MYRAPVLIHGSQRLLIVSMSSDMKIYLKITSTLTLRDFEGWRQEFSDEGVYFSDGMAMIRIAGTRTAKTSPRKSMYTTDERSYSTLAIVIQRGAIASYPSSSASPGSNPPQ